MVHRALNAYRFGLTELAGALDASLQNEVSVTDLDVQFLSDTSPLNSTRPHIQVFWLPPANYNEYGNSLLYALANPAGVVFVLLGVILSAFEVLKSIRKAHIHR
jgi:hypothetical protein